MTREKVLDPREALYDEFCAKYNWSRYRGRRRWCDWLIVDPRHVCYNEVWCRPEQALRRYPGAKFDPGPRPNFDHVKRLFRGDMTNPDQWAILSQPYNTNDPTGSALFLGAAPYGHGSHALLYVGLHVDDPRRLRT